MSTPYQRQGKLEEAEGVLLRSLEIDPGNLFAMAELVRVYENLKEPDVCLEKVDLFLSRTRIRKGRTPQSLFNNVFRLCSTFGKREEAGKYHQQYRHILDERNVGFYGRLFGD